MAKGDEFDDLLDDPEFSAMFDEDLTAAQADPPARLLSCGCLVSGDGGSLVRHTVCQSHGWERENGTSVAK